MNVEMPKAKLALTAFLTLLFSQTAVYAQQDLELPAWVQTYLGEHFADWRLDRSTTHYSERFWEAFPRCHPSKIAGDFDDDGRRDYAVLLEKDPKRTQGAGSVLLAFLAEDDAGFLPVTVDEFPGSTGAYLCLTNKGEVSLDVRLRKTLSVTNPADGIVLSWEDRAAACYFVDRSRVKQLICAD